MKELQFRCTLLSDVIVNVTAATTGVQSSLDFLPGNLFLGIVARNYDQFGNEQMNVFHNGHVRFGDAHPCPTAQSGQRSLQIPASMYYPKLESASEACYIHHHYRRDKDHEGENGRPQQLKQCRSGFYTFAGGKGHPAVVEKSFAIKSAYDRVQRRSKDEQMFGYEAIVSGQTFLFSVEVDNELLAADIEKALVGIRHIGRSKTAQYGQVRIERTTFSHAASTNKTFTIGDRHYATVYADGRLVFIDQETGQTKLRPEASDLGLEGDIDWQLSQVRTFQYAPWNNKRQCRDTERCGIEKGSVVVVRLSGDMTTTPTSSYVGSYNNEGFGRVIYNPDFLLYEEGTNGKAVCQICKKTVAVQEKPHTPVADTPLLNFVLQRKRQREKEAAIYEMVNDFVSRQAKRFRGKIFASQWGAIRSIAMRCSDGTQLWKELFDKQVKYRHHASPDDPIEEDRYKQMAYLEHGVAAKKWDERNGQRKEELKKFIWQARHDKEYGDIAREAVVNLAAEMAKKCN